ncbi:MAG: hypothetical protein K2X29_08835 [Candidatus Obscuribacterales bacterium]|nr:hypothetical protein [Candidatus Obscuribacterales bacterium]
MSIDNQLPEKRTDRIREPDTQLDKSLELHRVRNASGSEKQAVLKANKNDWHSEQGLFAITDDGMTVSQKTAQEVDSDENLVQAGNQRVARNLEYDGRPPTLLFPDPETAAKVGEAAFKVVPEVFEHTWNPYKGHELEILQTIPDGNWHVAYEAFPELHLIPENETTRLMKAIILNELEHYDLRDKAQDAGLPVGRTLGITQLSAAGIKTHAQVLEHDLQAGKRKFNPLHSYLSMSEDELTSVLKNPSNAPLLVAENLAYNIRQYRRHNYPVSLETLAYGYNPDVKNADGLNDLLPDGNKRATSAHIKNVMGWYHFLESAERKSR